MTVNTNKKSGAERTFSIGGSVLGSIMYLIYINDMGNLGLNRTSRLYADDSSVFCMGDSNTQNIETLKLDIEKTQRLVRKTCRTVDVDHIF